MSPRATDVLSRIVLLAGAVASVATSSDQPACDSDEECQAPCQRNLERAAAADAVTAEEVISLAAAGCAMEVPGVDDDDVSERPQCTCERAQGESYDLWGDDGHCLVLARNGTCLLSANELPRDLCIPGDAGSCATVCADLETRLAEDAIRPVSRTLVGAECDYLCWCSTDVDGTCYRHAAFRVIDHIDPLFHGPCP